MKTPTKLPMNIPIKSISELVYESSENRAGFPDDEIDLEKIIGDAIRSDRKTIRLAILNPKGCGCELCNKTRLDHQVLDKAAALLEAKE